MQTQTARFPLPAAEFTFAGFSWPRRVATLPTGTTARRLERYMNPVTGPYYHAPRPVEGAHPGKGFYLASDGAPGLRWVWCDHVEGLGRSIDHTGWFTDEHGDGEKIRGVVFRLPHGRGFMAGWSMGEGMATSLDAGTYGSEIDAAFAADGMAETAAENEREYQAQQDSETDDSAQLRNQIEVAHSQHLESDDTPLELDQWAAENMPAEYARLLELELDENGRDRAGELAAELRNYFDAYVIDGCDFELWVSVVACDTVHTLHSAAVEYAELALGQ